jgi:hypothetical protein
MLVETQMRKFILLSIIFATVLTGCAGSPVRMAGQSVNQIINDANLGEMSLTELCGKKAWFVQYLLRQAFNPSSTSMAGTRKGIEAVDAILVRRGYDKRYCEGGSYASKKTFTQARQPRSSAQANTEQSPATLQLGEIDPNTDINNKVRSGQSRTEALRSIGNPAEITRFGGVVATSYCQTGLGGDNFVTLWFNNGGLAEIESKLEYRGTGNCTEFISKPSEDDIPQKLKPKRKKDTHTYSNGVTYSGEFKDGIFHGAGEMTYANGDTFVGQFVNGASDGQGQVFNASGDLIFEGRYEEGKPNGFGISYPVGKRAWSAIWKDGKVVKETFKWLDEQ